MPKRSLMLVAFAPIVGLITATPVMGQATGQGAPLGSTRQAIAARVPVDSLVERIGLATTAAIDDARDAAEREQRSARNRRSRAERARATVRMAVDDESREIERVEKAMEIADDLDQTARKAHHERDLNLRSRYRGLLQKRSEVYEFEMELAEREERHARALLERLEVERRLVDDHRRWRLLHGKGAVWANAAERRNETERTILERLRDYFEAEREEARQRERVAESRRELAEKQLELIELRRDLFED